MKYEPRDLGDAAEASSGGGGSLVFSTNDLLQLRYSRKQEEAADGYALGLLHRSYGHAEGAEKLFGMFPESGATPGWAHMFSTHPNPADRIERLRKSAPQNP